MTHHGANGLSLRFSMECPRSPRGGVFFHNSHLKDYEHDTFTYAGTCGRGIDICNHGRCQCSTLWSTTSWLRVLIELRRALQLQSRPIQRWVWGRQSVSITQLSAIPADTLPQPTLQLHAIVRRLSVAACGWWIRLRVRWRLQKSIDVLMAQDHGILRTRVSHHWCETFLAPPGASLRRFTLTCGWE